MKRYLSTLIAAFLCGAMQACAWADEAASAPAALISQGRHLVRIAGCNECHTAGYGALAGRVPEAQWLTGDALGWNGPWGTTYASNLRLYFAQTSEQQWLHFARNAEPRPPMPWPSLRAMSDADLRAIYAYIRDAGPAGSPAPAALPPGVRPPPPYVQLPVRLPR